MEYSKETINTAKNIIQTKTIDLFKLNPLIIEYVKNEKNIDVTTTQLQEISKLIQSGAFNLMYACEKILNDSNVTVCKLFDKNGNLIKIKI